MRRVFAFIGLALALGAAGYAGWSALMRNPEGLGLRALGEAGGYAYVYGYPLVLTDLTQRKALAEADEPALNRLYHRRTLPDASENTVVRLNLDTLYTLAFLDLSQGPVVLSTPDFGERDWIFQVLDAWTFVAGAPSRRVNGSGPHRVMIVGPDGLGGAETELPVIEVRTRQAWMLGRIAMAPGEDLKPVHALQDQVRLSGTRPTERPAALPGRPPIYLEKLDPDAVFAHMADHLVKTDPDPARRQMLVPLGLDPETGQYDPDSLGPLARWAVHEGVKEARAQLRAAVLDSPYGANNWRTIRDTLGAYTDADFGLRAGVAMVGFGANRVEDAIYPNTEIDSRGDRLHGDHRYQLRFAPDQIPPVRSFWSVTVYDSEGYLLDTGTDRHGINSQSDLAFNPDGGLTLTFSTVRPDNVPESNWLPVQAGAHFVLTARLYSPLPSVLNATWDMPAVERLDP